MDFASVSHDNRLPDSRFLRKFPRSQHWLSLVTLPSLKIRAYIDPLRVGNFARLIGVAFAFLQMNLLRDCYLQTQQISRRHTTRRNYVKNCCMGLLSNISHVAVARTICRAGTKECETLYRSFIRAPVWTDSDRAVSSLISRLDQKIWVYLAITGKFTTWKRNHGKNARGTEQKPKIIESLPYDWWVTSITNQVQIGVTYTWEWAVRWSTQLRSQPVATQHSLRNCVDHLTAHRWIRCS